MLWRRCSEISTAAPTLLAIFCCCCAFFGTAATTTTAPPTACYESGTAELLPPQLPSALCPNASAVCSLRWQARVDWAAGELLDLVVRFEQSGRCLDSWATLQSTALVCSATPIDGSVDSVLTLQLRAHYGGGSLVLLAWNYRSGGQNLSCDALALDASAYDAEMQSRTLDVYVSAADTALVSVDSAALPLGAFAIECPLLPLECQCRVGCTYDAAFWREHAKNAAWKLLAAPTSVCGLPLAEWVAGSHATTAYPLQVRNALRAYAAARLNLALFGCAAPAEDAALAAYDSIVAALVDTDEPKAHCMGADAVDVAYDAFVLAEWNAGAFANVSGPCSCTAAECALRYADTLGDEGATAMTTPNADAVNDAAEKIGQWDAAKLSFFIVMLVVGAAFLASLVCIAYLVCRTAGIGPAGFGNQMPIYSQIGSAAYASNELPPPPLVTKTSRVGDLVSSSGGATSGSFMFH